MRAKLLASSTLIIAAVFLESCAHSPPASTEPAPPPTADAHPSFNGKHLTYASGAPCEQLYMAKRDGSDAKRLPTQRSRVLNPSFLPNNERILFTGNYAADETCPAPPPETTETVKRDTRPLTQLYTIKTDGTDLLPLEPGAPRAYNGEAAVCKDGSVVFVSNREDDIELYRGQLDNLGVMTSVKRITQFKGQDSSPAFSADCTHITWQHEAQSWTALADGSHAYEITSSEASSRFKNTVEKLSASDMQGRALGTLGLGKAEDFVLTQFKEIGLKPYTAAFKEYLQPVEMVIGKDRQVVLARNVIGAWGKACGRGAPVVIGAHLDHLGSGGPESLEPTQKGIHPGADDNASGVAGILEAARLIVANKTAQKSCFVFVAFTGEETSIAGSSSFVAHLKDVKIKPKAMLNLDMVGRMENSHLLVFGSDSAQEWKTLVDHACLAKNLTCDGGGDGYGPSDHMPFYMAGVPVLHFFTGPHEDYHRTTDTADKVHFTGGVITAGVVSTIALQVAPSKQALHYLKPSSTPTMGVLAGSGEKRGNGAYLGTIPDYSKLVSPQGPAGGGEPRGGVRLGGVRAGSPAEKAGILPGDILLGIGPVTSADSHAPKLNNIRTLEDFMNVLVGLHPDDDVVLQVRRDDKLLQLQAKVGQRN